MSIRIDYHTHSEISPDGKSDMEHMCQSAIEKKIQEIVFTDHYECYAYGVRSRNFHSEYVRTYFEHIEKIQKKYQGILNVKSGVELGQSYLNSSEAKNVLNHPFDYVIGSLHKLGNIDLGWIQFTESNAGYIGDTYYRCLEELAKNGEYDCIGHLDYYKKHCARAGLSDRFEHYRPIIKNILMHIIERGKGIEVNTGGFKYGLGHPNPTEDIIKRYHELGGEIITMGADAHVPEYVAYEFDKTAQIIKNCGFKYYTVFKNRKAEFIPL